MSAKVLICYPLRTAIGSFGGVFSSLPAPQLASAVLREILTRSGIDSDKIDEVILGCVLTAGQGQAPARQALLAAGISERTQALTINKVCSSGLRAVMLAAGQVASGSSQAVLAGGMENMSQAPYLLPAFRQGARLGHQQAIDSLIHDGLWDPYGDQHMGSSAELCAEKYGLSREEQDQFALESYRRANAAITSGLFKKEIVEVTVPGRKTNLKVSQDEEPAKLKAEKVPSLRSVFKKDGTVTAANASSINDGAAALLVCSEAYARKFGLTAVAEILSSGYFAQEPEWFTTAPVGAINAALGNAKLAIPDIDLFEINEAFAAVALACGRELKISFEKININGGAVALGHPIGASGARILVTLLQALEQRGKELGAVGICNGGGEATALVVKKL